MKILKLQDFFNESFGGIMFIRQSFGCTHTTKIHSQIHSSECIYNTICGKYGEYHYQLLKQVSDISSVC